MSVERFMAMINGLGFPSRSPVRKFMPGAVFRVAGAGHLVQTDRPDASVKIMRDIPSQKQTA